MHRVGSHRTPPTTKLMPAGRVYLAKHVAIHVTMHEATHVVMHVAIHRSGRRAATFTHFSLGIWALTRATFDLAS